MFERSSELKFGDQYRVRTPLLIPSFSSKGFPEVRNLVEYTSEFITGPILVSAYDLHHKKVPHGLAFAPLVFLDSGGYEAKKDLEISAPYRNDQAKRLRWTLADYQRFTRSWRPDFPTVIVSYDSPRRQLRLASQLRLARREFDGISKNWKAPPFLSEILIKPERRGQTLPVRRVVELANRFHDFDIVGVTADELGSTPLQRLVAIAKIRSALSAVGCSAPIHVFGSLDPVTTPLYFLAGAEIFDGLTWLRMCYSNGSTLYVPARAVSMQHGLQRSDGDMRAQILKENLYALASLERAMTRFVSTKRFDEFSENRDLFEGAMKELDGQLVGER